MVVQGPNLLVGLQNKGVVRLLAGIITILSISTVVGAEGPNTLDEPAAEPCYNLTLGHSGSGTDPIPTPGNSTTCAPGSYVAGESISLSTAPDPGWGQSGWAGTINDTRKGTENRVTMPASGHAVSVTYSDNLCFALMLGHSGGGADPIPEAPPGVPYDKGLICRLGEYTAADIIFLMAEPNPWWVVDGWTGTDDDSSSSPENAVTMPESERSASVTYTASTDGFVSKLMTANPHPGAQLGGSVAINVNTAVVGSPGDFALSANVFERDQNGSDRWGVVKRLVPAEPVTGGDGARSVAVSGDTVAVGEVSNTSLEPGVVYIFERNLGGSDNWGEVIKIQAPEDAERDWFGRGVATEGNTLAVAAPFDSNKAGAVWIFERDMGGPDNWGAVRKVVSSKQSAGHQGLFGLTMALDGDLLLAYSVDTSLTDPESEVYFFERNQGGVNNWGETEMKPGAPTAQEYAKTLAVNGDIVAIGLRSDSTNGVNSGAVSIYERDAGGAGNWGLVRRLQGAGSEDHFGESVALTPDVLVVGATDHSEATSGQVRIYGRDKGGTDNWGLLTTLSPYDGGGGDLFGFRTAIDEATVVVGAPRIGEWDFGSAYIFELLPSPICYSLALGHTGFGSDPLASPSASSGCEDGFYVETEAITLTADPATDWEVSGWIGSDNDGSTSALSNLTMPATNHTVTVKYSGPPLIFVDGFE